MKRMTLTSMLVFCFALGCFAQQNKLNKDTSLLISHSLFIFKFENRPETYSGNYILFYTDTKDIKNLEIYNSKDTIARYGPTATNGVFKITLKKNIPLISAEKLFRKYNIQKRYGSLPVYIDSTITNHIPKFFSPGVIKNVTVATDMETGSKYISIESKFNKVKTDPHNINIRGLSTEKN